MNLRTPSSLLLAGLAGCTVAAPDLEPLAVDLAQPFVEAGAENVDAQHCHERLGGLLKHYYRVG